MNRRLPLLAAGWLAVSLPLSPTAAQDFSGLEEPLISDRPDFTESTDTVPRGHFQLEGGFTSTRVDDEDSRSFGELLLRIGLSERLEARIGAGSHTRIARPGGGDASGYEDPGLGVKIRLSPETEMLPPSRPAVALLLGTSIPVGDEELTEDEWVPEAKLAFGWTLTERFGLSSNLNWAFPPGFDAGDGDERFHQFSGSLSGSLSFTDRIGGFLEYYGFTEEEEDGPSTHYVNTGVTYLLSNDLQLDLRYGRGLNDPDPDDFVGIGAAVRW